MMNDPFKQYQDLMKSIDKIANFIKPYHQIQEMVRINALERNKTFAAAARISQVNPAIAAIGVSDISKAIANAVKTPEVDKAIADSIRISNINKAINFEKISSPSLARQDILSPSCNITEEIKKSQLQISQFAACQQLKILENLKQQTDIWQKLIQPNLDSARLLQSTMPQIRQISENLGKNYQQSLAGLVYNTPLLVQNISAIYIAVFCKKQRLSCRRFLKS